MSECIICLDPCTDYTHCCKAPIHAACIGSVLEKGFNKCPHCQKEMYPAPPPAPEPQIQYMAIPVIAPPRRHYCSVFVQGVGIFVLLNACVSLIANAYW